MGFKIIRDFIKEKDEKGAVGNVSIRQTGFKAMFMTEEEQQQCEYRDGKIKVRLKDDDKNVYYHALVDDEDFSAELLLQWGMSYAGCTSLDLHIESAKLLYDNFDEYIKSYPNMLSKDGKWLSHMG